MRYLTYLVLFLCIFIVSAQQDTISTDRPTQSAGAYVVPKGYLQVEAGYLVEQTTSNLTNFTYANFLVRYGLLEGAELRITQNYVGFEDDETSASSSGLSPLTIGSKVHLLEENGLRPEVSVIGQVTIKSGNEDFQPTKAVPEFRLNFVNTLSKKISLGYNIGMLFPEDNTTSFYSAVVGFGFGNGWTVFAEPYGFFSDGESDHRFNTGLIYLAKRNLQFDIAGGIGLSDNSPDSYLGLGVSVGL